VKKFNVVSHLIHVNVELEWSIYDRKGDLLLDKGACVTSLDQLNTLRKRGIYRLTDDPPDTGPPTQTAKNKLTVFDSVRKCATQLEAILAGIAAGTLKNANEKINALIKTIQTLCESNTDAMLGAVHLLHDIRYTAIHPLHKAILCGVVASHLDLTAEQRFALLAAALTGNVSVIKFQEELRHQASPLTNAQWVAMKSHPEEGISMLKRVGVSHSLWFDIIKQHHERADGSGYYGLTAKDICQEARILGIADVYSASVSPRAYRQSRLASESLKDLFLDQGHLHDAQISLVLIKVLSVFPPGTFVRLDNKDVAIVIKRPADNVMWPEVKSILRANGEPYYNPVHRDTNQDGYGIKEMCRLEEKLPYNLSEIW